MEPLGNLKYAEFFSVMSFLKLKVPALAAVGSVPQEIVELALRKRARQACS
jgi:hypothetical protein